MGGSQSDLRDALARCGDNDLMLGASIILPGMQMRVVNILPSTEFPSETLRRSIDGKRFRWYRNGKVYEIHRTEDKIGGRADEDAVSCVESYPSVITGSNDQTDIVDNTECIIADNIAAPTFDDDVIEDSM